MLNKFKDNGGELAEDTPEFKIMDAWAKFVAAFQQYEEVIRRQTALVQLRQLQNYDPVTSDYIAEIEEKIGEVAPRVTSAIAELRAALDLVVGWHIEWRQAQIGDVIGYTAIQEVAPDISIMETVRAPQEFHKTDGWVVGSVVGVDPIGMNPLNAYITISGSFTGTTGLNFPMPEMYEIEFTPPSRAAQKH